MQLSFGFFKKDEVIFRNGDDGDYFYIIISGQVDLYLINTELKKLNAELNILERRRARNLVVIWELEVEKSQITQIADIAV